MDIVGQAIDLYREASENVMHARVRYAQEWQIARAKVNSDQHATQIAVEKTRDELTDLVAQQRAAELTLQFTMKEHGRVESPS